MMSPSIGKSSNVDQIEGDLISLFSYSLFVLDLFEEMMFLFEVDFL